MVTTMDALHDVAIELNGKCLALLADNARLRTAIEALIVASEEGSASDAIQDMQRAASKDWRR